VAYRARAKKLFDVPPESFIPAPKVTSSVIKLEMLEAPAVKVTDEKLFFEIIKAAFAQRRKQLSNSLANAFPRFSKETVQRAIEQAGLSPDVRGEKLSLADFARLSDILEI
jgi:16S rRNA (adenine1518-N6/adenine1519-N6)-dimethyltransferase